jgi:hypothetical protein
MDLEITPEPTDVEREAIEAALGHAAQEQQPVLPQDDAEEE